MDNSPPHGESIPSIICPCALTASPPSSHVTRLNSVGEVSSNNASARAMGRAHSMPPQSCQDIRTHAKVQSGQVILCPLGAGCGNPNPRASPRRQGTFQRQTHYNVTSFYLGWGVPLIRSRSSHAAPEQGRPVGSTPFDGARACQKRSLRSAHRAGLAPFHFWHLGSLKVHGLI